MSDFYKTEQENFWAGDFGTQYIERNRDEPTIASNVMFFSKMLCRTAPIYSAIEFGANIGLSILAMKRLLPSVKFAAVEINAQAADHLRAIQGIDVFENSILEFDPPKEFDLSISKGVLIHIDPEHLPVVYEKLYQASGRYILLAEYYNPTPVEVTYRGHDNKLFKRDFAGEMMDRFEDLKLIDYGFVYHRDAFPQDDMNWFLMEKTNENRLKD